MRYGAEACDLADSLTSADPVDLGAQSDLIGAAEPMSIEAVLAGQIAAGRALLMTFYVIQREAEDRGSPRQTGLGSGAGSALLPGPGAFAGGLAIGRSCHRIRA